ncbi:MAG: ThuA domain-containing protein [Saprospiraceae bacterium]|nr:ThuA domain-containing protein [Saprospiraceae bacterium]
MAPHLSILLMTCFINYFVSEPISSKAYTQLDSNSSIKTDEEDGRKRVLVYIKNGNGYVHDNRAASITCIQKIGKNNGFIVDHSDNPADINEENLKKYQAIVLSNTNNETFDTDGQKLAFQRFIEAGGGLVGIHSASGYERKWPWFTAALGGRFKRHPPLQKFDVKVVDANHPSTAHLNETWKWEDECYYTFHLNPEIHTLLAADLSTVNDSLKVDYPGEVFGNLFPLSWYMENYNGRQWYTALGHKIEYYEDPTFVQHLTGGIIWVLQNKHKIDYKKASKTLKVN